MEEKYYIGLDMGTGSVGWAVTDSAYHVIKRHGKALWGIRLFESALTAEERRTFRASRRRLQRRKQRTELLQEIFAEEIAKVDTGFYQRMKESRYCPEDKRDEEGKAPFLPYALFVDKSLDDKDYHKSYPTIYHLRKELIESDEQHDVRLVYLALHHIIKHRGHFLFEGKEFSSITDFSTAFDALLEAADENEIDTEVFQQYQEKIESVLKDKTKGRSAKKTELFAATGVKSKQLKAMLTMITGGTVKLAELFDEEELSEADRNKFCFADNSFDDYSGELETLLDERYNLILAGKAVYDWAVLTDIVGNYTYLSDAKVAVFEKHKSDLGKLKTLLKRNKDLYNQVFGVPAKGEFNYSAYIGMVKKNGRKQPLEKNCSKEDFYDYLKKILVKLPQNEEIAAILSEIETNTFMPKQVIRDNGVIPFQLHEKELNRILENAAKYLPFLREKDKDGISNTEKIKAIFRFRIPYYVGPLNTYHSQNGGNSWMERREGGAIRPWNFQQKVDEEKSAEHFIRRMTNKCTYLIGKDVLPKDSILYSKFMVLNELNNLKIDDEPVSVELKQKLYEDLFLRYRKVTGKKLKDYLLKEGIISKEQTLSGFDQDFKASMKAYLDFKELGLLNLSRQDMDNIILDITLFSDAKKMLRKRLHSNYPLLTEAQVKSLSEKAYAGWGALSGEFLCDIKAPDPETGEAISVIQALWQTNDNLMQLLSKKYLFTESITEENAKLTDDEKVTYETVQNLYVSPSVKRPVWQTIQIVNEIEKIMGYKPARIFVEMAREKQDSKRTVSRKRQLQELYAACKKEEPQWINMLAKTDDNSLRSDRLYLYYTQKGRCMYSGEAIDLEQLYDTNIYDVDHIYPQSKVMDDSLNNRVLVRKDLNAKKSDSYPVPEEYRKKCKPFWEMLLHQGFITKEKYNRLVRSSGFEESELAGFIARQIVETRQSTKAVTELLTKAYPQTDIVYAKANAVSEFRHEFDMFKVREINDYHHAKDAYLNIVVGNTYYVKFTKDAAWFVRNNPGRTYNLRRMFEKGSVERNGEVAWISQEKGTEESPATIYTVKKYMQKNSILFTRKPYEVSGGLFDQQLMKKGKGQVPIKSGTDERLKNIEKYGGYNKAKGAYFFLVESDGKKGVKKRTLEVMPAYRKAELAQNQETLLTYCRADLSLVNPRIILSKIRIDSLICIDGFYAHISGRTGNQIKIKNANQLILPQEDAKAIKKIVKFCNRLGLDKSAKLSEQDELSESTMLRIYDTFLQKIQDTFYGTRLAAPGKSLVEGKEEFIMLSREEKCKVLYEILHLFQCNSGACNLSTIKGPAHSGVLVMNNDINILKEVVLLNQSITGFYEQIIDLKTV